MKSRKISEQQPNATGWLQGGIGSMALFVCVVILIHCTMFVIHPDIQFFKEWIGFMSYADMGIPQGYVILPLLAMMGYQQFRMEFVMLGKHRTIALRFLWKKHHQGFLIAIGAVALALGLSYWKIFPDVIYLLGIVLFTSVFQLFQLRTS